MRLCRAGGHKSSSHNSDSHLMWNLLALLALKDTTQGGRPLDISGTSNDGFIPERHDQD